MIATVRFKGGEAKSRRYTRGVGFFRKENEEIKAKGGACKSPPQLDGGIRQFQSGICLHEGRTPIQEMGASQGASWRDYIGGI
jgi:hypothetical protein